MTHAPPSTRYIVFRIPVPLWSRTENESGVEEVTYVSLAVTFGAPTTRFVTGPARTSTVHVNRLFESFPSATVFPASTSALIA